MLTSLEIAAALASIRDEGRRRFTIGLGLALGHVAEAEGMSADEAALEREAFLVAVYCGQVVARAPRSDFLAVAEVVERDARLKSRADQALGAMAHLFAAARGALF